MEQQITILPLSNADRDPVAALILAIQQQEFNVPITLADQPDLMDLENFYFHPGGHFWGASVDGELVGTIGLLAPGRIGVIRKMFVKAAYRGKEWSIAQQLLNSLIEYARTHGINDIYLGTIDRMKAAHRFYERNGFKSIPKDLLPAEFPLMQVDNTFYHLQIVNPIRQ